MSTNSRLWTLSALYGEGAVLQHDEPLSIHGTGPPRKRATLEFLGQRTTVKVGDDGNWSVTWAPQPAGGPFSLRLDDEIWIQQWWIGDVWICAGQSNMERNLEACEAWPDEAQRHRGDSRIRQFCVENRFDFVHPLSTLPPALWIGADTKEVGKFSAIGMAFAQHLREQTDVPQGLILIAVGGSSAQAWMCRSALVRFPLFLAEAEQFARSGWLVERQAHETTLRNAWYRALEFSDPKTVIPSKGWSQDPLDSKPGSAWIRTRFFLSEPNPGPARLNLGTMVDSDDCWVNGVWVGSTGYQYPTRRYVVPAGLLRKGENELVLRLVAPQGGLGLTPDKRRFLQIDTNVIDLKGPWENHPGATVSALRPDTFLPLYSTGLYNGMLASIGGVPCRAVLWYQGESNTESPDQYDELLETMIGDWRRLWNRPHLPFLLVQLPLVGISQSGVSEHGWATIRDYQRQCLRIPNTALAIALDLGEWNDIHPSRKREVGCRLARLARSFVLKESLVPATGPLIESANMNEGLITLTFRETGEGLATNGPLDKAFFAAQSDGVFAVALLVSMRDNFLTLRSPWDKPVEVRYAWAGNPEQANLVNSAGLPASPFKIELS